MCHVHVALNRYQGSKKLNNILIMWGRKFAPYL